MEDDFCYTPDYHEIIPFEEMAAAIEAEEKHSEEEIPSSKEFLTFDEIARVIEDADMDSGIPILKKFHEFF